MVFINWIIVIVIIFCILFKRNNNNEVNEKVVQEIICHNCNKELSSDMLWCPYCGLKLVDDKEEDISTLKKDVSLLKKETEKEMITVTEDVNQLKDDIDNIYDKISDINFEVNKLIIQNDKKKQEEEKLSKTQKKTTVKNTISADKEELVKETDEAKLKKDFEALLNAYPRRNDNKFDIDYYNENYFKKLERGLKKCNMFAYKKLMFDFYPKLRSGEFIGELISLNKSEEINTYSLKLPTDSLFIKVYGEVKLNYTVYVKKRVVILNDLEPKDILLDGYKSELTTYKGIMISKANAQKEMFKIDLLCRLEGRE